MKTLNSKSAEKTAIKSKTNHFTKMRLTIISSFIFIALMSTAAFSSTSSAKSARELLFGSLKNLSLTTNSIITAPSAFQSSFQNTALVSDDEEEPSVSISTDKPDYQPGETVQMSGDGFQPGEVISLEVIRSSGNRKGLKSTLVPVIADKNGKFESSEFRPDQEDLGVLLTTVATGQNSRLVARAMFSDGPAADPTPTPVVNSYKVSTSFPETFEAGTENRLVGSFGDNDSVVFHIPFKIKLYGAEMSAGALQNATSTQVTVNDNGVLSFGSMINAEPPASGECLPTSSNFSNTIFALRGRWSAADLSVPVIDGSGGIYTSVSGVSPSRRFNVEWRVRTKGTSPKAIKFAVSFYENKNYYDVFYTIIPTDAGIRVGTASVVGVQKTRTTSAVPGIATQYTCHGNPNTITSDTKLRFTANSTPVANNDPSNGEYSAQKGQTLNVNASGVLANDTDADDDTLTVVPLSAQQTDNGGSVTLNANGSFSYTPAANYSGPDRFQYRVTDGTIQSAPATVNINVVGNSAPTVSDIADQTTNEDVAKSDIPFTISDVETAVGTLTVSGSSSDTTLVPNANITFGGTGANRTVTVTPAADKSGTATITVTATDANGATGTDTFLLTVNSVNDLPTITDISNPAAFNEDNSTGPHSFTIGDVETAVGTLTVSGSSSDTTLVPNANITFGGTGANRTVTVTPAADKSGTATITVTATDADGGIGTDTFLLTVNSVNDLPTITDISNPAAFNEDNSTGPHSFTIGDVETAVGTLTVSGSSSDTTLVPNANITFGGTGANRTVTVTPAANKSGTATITVTTTDADGGTNSDTFLVTVNAVNDAPTVSDVADQTTDEDTAKSNVSVTIGDVDNAAADLQLTGSSSDTTLVPNANITFGGTGANRTVTVTPAADKSGTATITVTATDADGGIGTDTFLLTVNSVNDLPTITDISNPAAFNEDNSTGPHSFTIGDVETAVGTLTVSGSSSDTTLVPNANITFGGTGANRTVTVTPAANKSGTATITVTTTDADGGTNSDTFVLTVNPVNDAPTVSDVADQTTNEDTAKSNVSVTIGDVDNAAADLQLTGSSANTTLVPNNNITFGGTGANRTVSITPAANQSGTATITVTVTDADNGTGTDTFVLTVNAVNDAPGVSSSPTPSPVQYSDAIAPVTVTAADVDSSGSALTASMSWKNSVDANFLTTQPLGGLTLTEASTATNSRTWTLQGNAQVSNGTYIVRVAVSDGLISGYTDITITVTKENASATYSGPSYFSTSSPTSYTANLTLSATVVDAADGARGDIRNAIVEFHRDSPSGTLLGTASPVGLVSSTDPTVGTATTTFNYSLTQTEQTMKGAIFDIYVVVKGYYTYADIQPTTVTVSIPGTDSVTGGGHLVLTSSNGQYAGTSGSKMNFGFTMQYNNKGTNLKGQANIIVRSNGRIYQIKSNAIDSLAVNGTTYPKRSTFTTKANMKDITDPLYPEDKGGNLTLQIDMTDSSTGGQSDLVGITVWNSNGGLFFTSNWNGTKTAEQTLGGGNIQVR